MHPRTPTLLELQQAVYSDLLSAGDSHASEFVVTDGLDARSRITIYRNTVTSTLVSSLRLSYPVVQLLVGAEFFEGAARLFIEQNPPMSAYLDAYGAGFPDFFARMPEAAALGYLPDTARLEWAVNEALHAPDKEPLEVARLACVEQSELGNVRFVAHPAVRMLQSTFPIDVIWRAVLDRDESALAQISLDNAAVFLLVRRSASGIEVERIAGWQWKLTAALLAGQQLGTALVGMPEAETHLWLASLLASGCFTDIDLSMRARELLLGEDVI
ncbi:HvfC/BufC family peptide modification chaperone [Noviherbaspirillum pedocola]|uniref:DNA-binding domain-containing protein n=1 Tax=Noviherbaspirillum pedocola TaxID=2801341 RepID=A0A934W4N4_9BURK|nr:putative DNA-binding domain-containing protein [Noviherbaspirillum pedocola]MBK4733015.1 putative DNA-binding domain-containing protein [Noviherbaspirillum pedocola]